jgi:release factor glutamine methyltransferase
MKFEDKVAQLRIKKHQGKETKEFLTDVVTMAQGEALEYLLGEVLFCDTKVDLSLRPMIPRKETEHWVRQALAEIGAEYKDKEHLKVLDLFSGSGCVGLAILKNIPQTHVEFVEYDPTLKKQIEISIAKNKVDAARVQVTTGDTWGETDGHFEVIAAVPPYVPPTMKDEVMSELSAETPLSFFDKEDGYYYHTQVLSRAKHFLTHDGILYLEFDITQEEKIKEIAKKYGWEKYSFLVDPYGHNYVFAGRNS